MKKIVFLLLQLLTIGVFAFAQPPTFQSPDVASLNKYIDFPVDKSTGTANISIPLFTIESKAFKLPISISYHTGGIKVEEMASSVGLGWSMHAGGMISRVVKGKIDEGGYYSNGGFLTPEVRYVDDPNWIDPYPGDSHYGDYVMGVFDTHDQDLEPDVFSFNFNGYSGKFLFDKNRNVHLIPEQDLKVQTTYLSNFIITTSDGTQYHFEGLKDLNQYFDVFGGSEVYNTWHLTKIITPTNETISFLYEEYGYEARVNSLVTEAVDPNNSPCAPCVTREGRTVLMGNIIKEIVSRDSRVRFLYKTSRQDVKGTGVSAKALERVEVVDLFTNQIVKQYQFKTSYFQSNDNIAINYVDPYTVETYLQKRLRLDEVQEVSTAGETMPPYKFYYNKNNPVAQLPNRLSNAQDHWGYYNGVSQNKCLIGRYNWWTTNCMNVADRSVKSQFTKAYALDEVVFPTGGVTQYIYDDHGMNYVPGLRIKEIINRANGPSEEMKKRYAYSSPRLTGGAPIYVQVYPIDYWGNVVYRSGTITVGSEYCQSQEGGENYLAFQQPVNYTGELAGNYAYYDMVTEHQPGNGSVESYYSTSEVDDYILNADVYPLIFNKPAINAGKLIQEIVRREDGSFVKETKYSYDYYYRNVIKEADAAKLIVQKCSQTLRFFPLYTGFSFLKQKEDITYSKSIDGQDVLFSVKTAYDYNGIPEIYRTGLWAQNPNYDYGPSSHHFVTKEAITTSDGGTYSNIFIYPTEDMGQGISTDLINKYMIGSVLEQRKLRGTTLLNTDRTYYQYWGSLIAPSRMEVTRLGVTETTFRFDSYDAKGNVLSAGKEGDVKTSYVWGYKSTYPVIKAENISVADLHTKSDAVLQEMGYANGLNDLDAFLASVGNLITASQRSTWKLFNDKLKATLLTGNVLFSTYTYAPLIGQTSATDANNQTMYYQYDSFGRLQVVLDNNGNILKTYQYNYKQ